MSYVYDYQRENIIIDLASAVAFVEVIEMFQHDYPSHTVTDDLPTTRNRRFDKRRDFPISRPSFIDRKFAPPPKRLDEIKNVHNNFDDSVERKTTQTLKVCSNPEPCEFTDNE
ncbi:hypothetical protein RF11_00887 [Thelohanellus kitauei]|uniref:Uncharacterized protein n=1 Tax=Thelohanellus kitauei TaxID=669202 RepID=A0A0C2IL15_THEKT|nr:hypothetical protein RF11_00887 [Thelohanellus kitauei]